MKIAIFTDIYGPENGGIASSIEAQKSTLEQLGHEVTVFFPARKKFPKSYGVIVPTCKHIHPDDIAISRRPKVIEKWVLKNFPNFQEFDIVHAQYEGGTSIAGMRLARKFQMPLVQTMHGREDSAVMINFPTPFKTIVAGLLNWFHSWYLPHTIKVKKDQHFADTNARTSMWTLMVNHANYADLVLTPSEHFKNKLHHYGVTKPIHVLTNTIDDHLLPKNLKARQFKDEEPLRMIWNSRLSHEKRFWEFIQALSTVKFPYHLNVYGEGNEFTKDKNWCKKHQLPVTFHGSKPRAQILAKMQECHLGISASYNFDTQGMNLLEGLATGLPMFFCDPDMKTVLPAGSYICSKSPSISAMAAALNQIVAHPEKISQMSQVAMKHRKDILSSTHYTDLEQIYKKMV